MAAGRGRTQCTAPTARVENVKSRRFYACFGTNKFLLAVCEPRECRRGVKRVHLEVEEGCTAAKPLAIYGHLWAIAYWAHFVRLKGLSLSS